MRQKRVRITVDDGTVGDLKVADMLTKYSLQDSTIFYWTCMPRLVNEPKGRTSLTDGDMTDISKEFTIGSHTVTHSLLTRIPIADAKNEIFNSRRILQDKFGQQIESFCYPRGYANADLQKMVQDAGYTDARSTVVGYIYPSENPYFDQTSVHVGYPRKEYGGKTWYEYAEYMLEQVKNSPMATFSCFLHSWELDENDAWTEFEHLLKQLGDIANE